MRNEHESLEYIHGGLDQSRRTSIFNRFKKSKIKVLIATDVAGRGLDFSHVTHVINFDFPRGTEGYTHRTGRTGRMGNVGIAMTLITARDFHGLKRLLKANSIKPTWLGKVPNMTDSRPGPRQHRRPQEKQQRSKGRPFNKTGQQRSKKTGNR